MKKFLISIIFILMCAIIVLVVLKGIHFLSINVSSIHEIKAMHENLIAKNSEAIEKTKQVYPESLAKLKEAINNLKVKKALYEEKVQSISQDVSLSTTQIKKYKIEYLWTNLGEYAEKNNVGMQMDIVNSDVTDTYNLQFTVIGKYINVTDFMYDIENDTDLNFKVSNFIMVPENTRKTTTVNNKEGTNTTVEEPYSGSLSIHTEEVLKSENQTDSSETKNAYDPEKLQAEFTVYGIGINFN